jgi:hypothetical protein
VATGGSGEVVRIKSREEVVANLDGRRANRGMAVCAEMLRCCGAQATVRARLDRFIDEQTGEMREIRDTVSLCDMTGPGITGDSQCYCYGELGDCPRGEPMYWREAWLERVGKAPRLRVEPAPVPTGARAAAGE